MAVPWLSAAERERRYAQLEEEMHMCQIRTRYNSLSPICCLSPEILAKIFADVVHSQLSPATWELPGPATVTLSHVCQHWREVALHFPNLWSNIDLCKPNPQSEMMLHRAKNSSLTVHGEVSDDKLELLKKLLQRLGQIQALSLFVPDHLVQVISERMSSASPLLKTCEITVTSSKALKAFSFPSRFLVHSPELRQLSLRYCYIPWDSPALRWLTSLRLTGISRSRPTSQELWAILLASPTLEELRLGGMLLASLDSLPSSWNQEPPVNLPRLRFIELNRAPFTPYVHFFSRVRIPPNAHIDGWVIGPTFEDELPRNLTLYPPSFLSAHRTHVRPCNILEIGLWRSSSSCRIYDLSVQNRGSCIHKFQSLSGECGISIGLTFHALISALRLLGPLWESGPLTSIHTLNLNTASSTVNDRHHDIPWFTFLAALPNLRVIRARAHLLSLSRLIDALSPSGGNIPVTQMDELYLSSTGDVVKIKGLAVAIERRAQAGACLTKLEGEKLVIEASELNRLRRLVDTVSWSLISCKVNEDDGEDENSSDNGQEHDSEDDDEEEEGDF